MPANVKGPSRGAWAFFPISLPAPPAAERVDRLHDVVEAVKQGADGLAAVLLLLGVVLEGLGLKKGAYITERRSVGQRQRRIAVQGQHGRLLSQRVHIVAS